MKSEKSKELYELIIRKGYPEEFAAAICQNLNTDWTAQRMIYYLSHYKHLPMEDVVDEMLGILADRDRIRQKKEMEYYQAKLNEFYRDGFGEDEFCRDGIGEEEDGI